MIKLVSQYSANAKLCFYLVDCGSGLTHLIIFPDKTVMLYDCNLVDDKENVRRGKDSILELFSNVIPFKNNLEGIRGQYIDIFVNSHRDTDHLRGLKYINERFPIQKIWDSGQTGSSTSNSDYMYYMGLRNRLKSKDRNRLVVPVPRDAMFSSFGGAEVFVLSDANEFESLSTIPITEAKDRVQHTNCLVLLIYYAGKKMLLTGDSDWYAWRYNIVPNFRYNSINYENTDILIASHHGSRTFFTNKDEINENKYPYDTYVDSIKMIQPQYTLISCGDYQTYHHPSRDAIKLYKQYTTDSRVYTTNDLGTIYGCIRHNKMIYLKAL